MASINLHQLLKAMLDAGGTDLHISTGTPPVVRLDGKLVPLKTPPLGPIESKQLCYSVLNESQKHRFEENRELDFSFGVKGLARFRGNVYLQKGHVAGAFRLIPFKLPEFEDLGLPEVVRRLSKKPRGLILVTGPTGSGKSTTLASMINMINRDRREHIITIEDPIEYLHQHRGCLINQREVGEDTNSFTRALKSILRQDPDVVLVGELRDRETIEAAMTIAETGHLTFATLHTNSAVQSINRIIDVFEPHQQNQIRTQLSFVLEGVMTQALLPKPGGGRALAVEVMVPNDAIRALIRDNKVHQIYSQMQLGQGQHGMQTFNQSLSDLIQRGLISRETGMARSSNEDELETMLLEGKGLAQVTHQRRT